ncbi:hypothetical protein RI054_09g50100 [Pseudoscourfieldia marina]
MDAARSATFHLNDLRDNKNGNVLCSDSLARAAIAVVLAQQPWKTANAAEDEHAELLRERLNRLRSLLAEKPDSAPTKQLELHAAFIGMCLANMASKRPTIRAIASRIRKYVGLLEAVLPEHLDGLLVRKVKIQILLQACKLDLPQVVRACISHLDMPKHSCDRKKRTALHYAVSNSAYMAVQAVLTSENPREPFFISAEENAAAASLFAQSDVRNNDILTLTIKRRDFDMLYELLGDVWTSERDSDESDSYFLKLSRSVLSDLKSPSTLKLGKRYACGQDIFVAMQLQISREEQAGWKWAQSARDYLNEWNRARHMKRIFDLTLLNFDGAVSELAFRHEHMLPKIPESSHDLTEDERGSLNGALLCTCISRKESLQERIPFQIFLIEKFHASLLLVNGRTWDNHEIAIVDRLAAGFDTRRDLFLFTGDEGFDDESDSSKYREARSKVAHDLVRRSLQPLEGLKNRNYRIFQEKCDWSTVGELKASVKDWIDYDSDRRYGNSDEVKTVLDGELSRLSHDEEAADRIAHMEALVERFGYVAVPRVDLLVAMGRTEIVQRFIELDWLDLNRRLDEKREGAVLDEGQHPSTECVVCNGEVSATCSLGGEPCDHAVCVDCAWNLFGMTRTNEPDELEASCPVCQCVWRSPRKLPPHDAARSVFAGKIVDLYGAQEWLPEVSQASTLLCDVAMLAHATSTSALRSVEYLRDVGVNLRSRLARGWTIMHIACQSAKGALVVRWLLQNGFDDMVNVTTDDGRLPLDIAIENDVAVSKDVAKVAAMQRLGELLCDVNAPLTAIQEIVESAPFELENLMKPQSAIGHLLCDFGKARTRLLGPVFERGINEDDLLVHGVLNSNHIELVALAACFSRLDVVQWLEESKDAGIGSNLDTRRMRDEPPFEDLLHKLGTHSIFIPLLDALRKRHESRRASVRAVRALYALEQKFVKLLEEGGAVSDLMRLRDEHKQIKDEAKALGWRSDTDLKTCAFDCYNDIPRRKEQTAFLVAACQGHVHIVEHLLNNESAHPDDASLVQVAAKTLFRVIHYYDTCQGNAVEVVDFLCNWLVEKGVDLTSLVEPEKDEGQRNEVLFVQALEAWQSSAEMIHHAYEMFDETEVKYREQARDRHARQLEIVLTLASRREPASLVTDFHHVCDSRFNIFGSASVSTSDNAAIKSMVDNAYLDVVQAIHAAGADPLERPDDMFQGCNVVERLARSGMVRATMWLITHGGVNRSLVNLTRGVSDEMTAALAALDDTT